MPELINDYDDYIGSFSKPQRRRSRTFIIIRNFPNFSEKLTMKHNEENRIIIDAYTKGRENIA